jgi:hypothetical protein
VRKLELVAHLETQALERRVAVLLTQIEPVMILVIGGGVVVLIVLATSLPIIEISQMLSRSGPLGPAARSKGMPSSAFSQTWQQAGGACDHHDNAANHHPYCTVGRCAGEEAGKVGTRRVHGAHTKNGEQNAAG